MATSPQQDSEDAMPAVASDQFLKKRRQPPLHDRVAQAVISGYDFLPGRGKPQGRSWTVLAGIVGEFASSEESPASDLKVLALATGTRCLGVAAMTAGQGQVVHDCHAEVLCRRAFHRYLLGEMVSSGTDSHADAQGILERREPEQAGEAPTWQIRSSVRLHFYVSALPCGECALVPISSCDEGTLARKLRREQGEPAEPMPLLDRNRTGAKPSMGMPGDPKDDGIGFHRSGVLRYKSGRSDTRPESRNVCYSCSEKICRWNHTGWQGALLSRLFKEPLRMSTIVIGGPLYDEGFVKVALFQRASPKDENVDAHCPEFEHTLMPFHSSREALEEHGNSARWTKVSTAGLSLVWSAQAPGITEASDDSAALPLRSISRNVPGFYDVIIGHTGERQGLRAERQGARKPGQGKTADAVSSWVSPLCKKIMVQDTLNCIASLLGSKEDVAKWLATGAQQAATTSRQGHQDGQQDAEAQGLEGDGQHPKTKRARLDQEEPGPGQSSHLLEQKSSQDSHLHEAAASSYCWFKEVMAAGTAYRERRARFHSIDPFLHWRRKCTLTFNEDPKRVDAFPVELGAGLSDCMCNWAANTIPVAR
eukprot:TRINITY_DN23641_c0_g1_i1.p1 TRINITY_DN23641_c0_g1~~TRINITY_DN23641_c0_g1_i1.p1  ORF type:complete len:607 (+),score=93.62 TRINITY_DN23641_c0_g1_i1:43-1821(+)